MNESDDDEGMPSLVHDSSENTSEDEAQPPKQQKQKKKKKAAPPQPTSPSEDDAQTGLRGLRKGFLDQDVAKGAASSTATSGDGLAELTAKELKELIGSAGLSTNGCIDKADLVEQARKAKVKLAEQQAQHERNRERREEAERARAAEQESGWKQEAEREVREDLRRKREEEKRLVDERARMAEVLQKSGVQGRGDLDQLKHNLVAARELLASADASKLRDAVNKAEKRLREGEEVVGVAERRAAELQRATERRGECDAQIKQKTKSLKAVGAKGGTERLEADLKLLVEQAAQLDVELGTGGPLPPAVAAQLALADASARRDQEARARAEAEVRTAQLETARLHDEKQALKERIAKRDQQIDDLRKEQRDENRKFKKERLVKVGQLGQTSLLVGANPWAVPTFGSCASPGHRLPRRAAQASLEGDQAPGRPATASGTRASRLQSRRCQWLLALHPPGGERRGAAHR